MLLKNENQIIRVLKSHGNKALVIDCIKKTMPKWVDGNSLSNFDDCGEDEMFERTDYPFGRELTPKEERIAQERFTMIAGVLPYIGNEQKRSQMIDFLAEHQSKQTIRKYLCLYLVYQDIDALAPPPRAEKELTQDEKNMRWALNKFFYTKHKNSLMTAYTLMLKEKYCDQQGQLMAAYPTFDQFRYFYRKTKKMQQYYISRDGIKDYQRNNRPLLGDGVQQFAPAVGVGMLDSTICDIYLVDDGGKLVGRAAYVLGYKVTPADTLATENIRAAQGATDTGVTICYNSVSDVRYIKPVVAAPCAMCINPVNWHTDATPAVLQDSITVTVSPEHHVLVLDGYSGSEYHPILGFLNVGDFHGCEPWLYQESLHENILERVKAYYRKENLR